MPTCALCGQLFEDKYPARGACATCGRLMTPASTAIATFTPDDIARMSSVDVVTGAAFVAADEAQYLTWLDGAAGEQKRLESRVERLREALRIAAIIMDHELKKYSPDYPSLLGDEEARSELGLLPGDLPEYD